MALYAGNVIRNEPPGLEVIKRQLDGLILQQVVAEKS